MTILEYVNINIIYELYIGFLLFKHGINKTKSQNREVAQGYECNETLLDFCEICLSYIYDLKDTVISSLINK